MGFCGILVFWFALLVFGVYVGVGLFVCFLIRWWLNRGLAVFWLSCWVLGDFVFGLVLVLWFFMLFFIFLCSFFGFCFFCWLLISGCLGWLRWLVGAVLLLVLCWFLGFGGCIDVCGWLDWCRWWFFG